jgi:hypothetical protein
LNPYEFLLGALLLVLGFLYVTNRDKNKSGPAEREVAGERSAEVEELQKEIAALDERIQVLERIVTDRRYDLDEEIKNLGD